MYYPLIYSVCFLNLSYYENDSETIIKESKYNPGAKYFPAEKPGSYERHGDRITKLGLNVYSSNKPVDTILPTDNNTNNKSAKMLSDYESNVPDPRAKAQIDLLCKLIGKSSASSSSNSDFKLNLFNNEEEEL